MTGRDGWQLERASAELYERLLVPTVTRPWARELVPRAELRPGDRVLDVAWATGVVARLAAANAGDGGRVAAVDVNRRMRGGSVAAVGRRADRMARRERKRCGRIGKLPHPCETGQNRAVLATRLDLYGTTQRERLAE